MANAVSPSSREEQILSLAKQVGIGVSLALRRCSPTRDLKEGMTGAAWIGAIKAVDRFDGRSTLKTYAACRIGHAIQDYLRAIDPLSRDQRSQKRDVDKGTLAVGRKQRKFSNPYYVELAAQIPRFISLDSMPVDEHFSRDKRRYETASDSGGVRLIQERLDSLDVAILLTGARLQEETMLRMHYLSEIPQVEIALRLGVSQCRVSHILTAGIARIRRRFRITPFCLPESNIGHAA